MKVNLKNAHKPNKNEKGGLGARVLRRRLPFTSCPNYLPLKGKKVYLDLKNFRGVKHVEEDLLALGATIEKFLSKEIHYLISSHDKARGHRSLAHPGGSNGGSGASQGVSTPSPGVSTPSPFNMGLDVSPAVISNIKKEQTSRGKALIRLARVDVARTVVDNAEDWGVRIVHIDTALKWILKEKEKALAVKGHSTVSQNVKPKKNAQKKGKLLKAPVVKFESDTRAYRPHYLELESWPYINVDTPRGTCPFDGVVMRTGGQCGAGAKGERLGHREPDGRPSPAENRGRDTPKPHTLDARPGSEKSDSVGFGHLVTGGQMKQMKEKRKRTDKKRGYCECCKLKYEDLHKHIQGDVHKKYVREEKTNYKDLDVLIGKGPTAEEFLQSVASVERLSSPVLQSQKSIGSTEDVVVLLSPLRTNQTSRKAHSPSTKGKSRTPSTRGKPCTPSRRGKLRTPSGLGKCEAAQDVKPAGKKISSKSPNSKIGAAKAASPGGKARSRLEMGDGARGDNLCQENVNEGSSPESLLKPCSVSCEVLQLSPSKSKRGAFVVKDVKSNSEITVTVADVGASAIAAEKTLLHSSDSSKENHQTTPLKRDQRTGDIKSVQPLKDPSNSSTKSRTSSGKRTWRLSLNKNSCPERMLTEVKTVENTSVNPVSQTSRSPKQTSNNLLTMQCAVPCLSPAGGLSPQHGSAVNRERKKARIVSSKLIRKCRSKRSKKKWRTFQSVRHFKLPQKWRMLSDRSVSKILSSDENSEKFEGFTEADLCLPSETPSDLSYVEVSQIALEEGSDIEWEITLPSMNSSGYEPLPSQLVTKASVNRNTAQEHMTKARKKSTFQKERNAKTHFRFSPPVDRSGLRYDPGDDFKCSPDVIDKETNFVFSSPIVQKCVDLQEENENLNEVFGDGNACKARVVSSPQLDKNVKKDGFLENLSSPFIFSQPVEEQLVTPIKTPSRLSGFADNSTSVQADDEIEFNFSSPQRLKTAFSPLKSSDFSKENPLSAVKHSRKGKSRTSKRLNLAEAAQEQSPSTAVHDLQPLPVNEMSSVHKKVFDVDKNVIIEEKLHPPQGSPSKCNTADDVRRRVTANLARHSPRDWSKYCKDSNTVENIHSNLVIPVEPVEKVKIVCVLGEQNVAAENCGEPNHTCSHSGLLPEEGAVSQKPDNRVTMAGHKGHRSSRVKPKSQPILVHQVKRNGGSLEISTSADCNSKDNQPQKKLLKKDNESNGEKKAVCLYRFDYITTADRNPKKFSTARRVRKASAHRSLSVPGRDVSDMSSSKRSISPGTSEASKRQRRVSENLMKDACDFNFSALSKWKSKSGRLIKPEDYQRRPRDEILHYSRTHLKKKKLAAAKHSNTGAGHTAGIATDLRSSPRKRNSPKKQDSPKKGDSLYDFDSS